MNASCCTSFVIFDSMVSSSSTRSVNVGRIYGSSLQHRDSRLYLEGKGLDENTDIYKKIHDYA
jgi:hypothetical protein